MDITSIRKPYGLGLPALVCFLIGFSTAHSSEPSPWADGGRAYDKSVPDLHVGDIVSVTLENGLQVSGQVAQITATRLIIRKKESRNSQGWVIERDEIEFLEVIIEKSKIYNTDHGTDPVLHRGVRVRMRESGQERGWVEGFAISHDSSRLQLLVAADTLTVPSTRIEKLQVSQGVGSYASTGATFGFFAFGALGLAIGLTAELDNQTMPKENAIGVALLCAVPGAVIGALFGAAVRTEKWVDVEQVEISIITTPDNTPGLACALKF